MRLLALALAMVPAAAFAHVTLESGEAAAGSTYKAVLRIPHGCDGEATNSVAVTLPEGFVGAKPMPKPGWDLTVKTGPYQATYTLHGESVSEGPLEIVWSGGDLPDAYYDEFAVRGQIGDLAEGTVLPFKVVQTCAGGTAEWTEVAGEGVDPHTLDHPAPALRVTAAKGGGHGGHGGHAAAAPVGTASVGDLVIEGAWTRATPPGAEVAGAYLSITNNGTAPDRLVGGSAGFARSVEVHSMSVENGMMKMGPIEGGLEIAPGATEALSPGGNHLMLMGLGEAPMAGGTVTLTLDFAKAGPVEITLPVAKMGATTAPDGSPAGGHEHMHGAGAQ